VTVVARDSSPGVYLKKSGPATVIAGVATFAAGMLIGGGASLLAERLRQRCRRT
jgi:hypothetical protein